MEIGRLLVLLLLEIQEEHKEVVDEIDTTRDEEIKEETEDDDAIHIEDDIEVDIKIFHFFYCLGRY